MTFFRKACVIVLLGALKVTPVLAQDWIYTARPGDTLWDLCLEYTARSGCWIELGRYNGITNDRAIAPGLEIRIPVAWLLAVPTVGEVISVQGEASYQEQFGAGVVPLTVGQVLALGSTIRCATGSVRLRLSDNSNVLLRQGSVLELTTMTAGSGPGQTSEITLDRGEVDIHVPPASRSRFEIHTPSAIAAVRGTRYRVVSEKEQSDSTRSEVLEGLVAVQAGASVNVPEGFGVKVQQGAAPGEPRKLLPAPVFATARVDSPLPLSIVWSADPGATAWRLDVFRGSSTGELLTTHRVETSAYTFSDLAEGCYRVTVRGIDAEGFNGLEGEIPLCVQAPVPAPVQAPVEAPRDYRIFVALFVLAALILL